MDKILQEIITQAEIANINGDTEAVKILLQAHTILFRAFTRKAQITHTNNEDKFISQYEFKELNV